MSDSDPTFNDVLNSHFAVKMAGVYVCRPGKIETFDAATQLASVKPYLKEPEENEDGSFSAIALPVIPNVPVMVLKGFTTPIAKGDTCVVFFADRSIDEWVDKDGDVTPADLRQHDMNDAFVFVGVRAKPNALEEYDENAIEIGNQGGVRTRITDDMVHLGVATGGEGDQFVALGQKVQDALEAIKTAHNNLVTQVISHVHPGVTSGASSTLVSVPGGVPTIGTLGPVAASKVKAT